MSRRRVGCGSLHQAVNILFLSLDFVFPADSGLRVRSLSQLRVLSSIESVEQITLLSLTETETSAERLRDLEREVAKVRAVQPIVQPTHMRRSPRHLPRLLRLRAQGVPYLIAKCDTPAMHALIERHLEGGNYDVVYIGHLGMAAYLSKVRRLAPRSRVVLEQHNVEWEIFERLAPSFRSPLRQIAHLEAFALRRYERRTLRAVDSVIAISDADGRAFRELAGVTASVVPTYIEPSALRIERTRAPSLGYTGLLTWQPNSQGLDWFFKDVWPLVRKHIPDATLSVAGPGLQRGADGSLVVPPNWSIPGIKVLGYVDDLEEVYRGSIAMIAPILGGSGVRMKLLESMRAGMPTVTTGDGAAGLAVEDGREMFVTDDPARFADCVVRLLSDAPLRERLREAGYEYLRTHQSLAVARAGIGPALSR
jgi:glycosyltransferase involved in cell wall biosynthesis